MRKCYYLFHSVFNNTSNSVCTNNKVVVVDLFGYVLQARSTTVPTLQDDIKVSDLFYFYVCVPGKMEEKRI